MQAEGTEHKHTPSIELAEAKLLLVEGVEDERFFSALQAHLGLSGIQIIHYGGKDKLRPFLLALPKITGFANVASLAVTRDANSSANDAFQSIQDALRETGLAVPAKPLVLAGGSPRVIALVLPHKAARGMLEDVCLQAVAGDPAMKCVENYFQCIQEWVTEPPRNIAKAKVHVFLASRPEPDLRLGEAAQHGYWPWAAQAFDPVKQLLQML